MGEYKALHRNCTTVVSQTSANEVRYEVSVDLATLDFPILRKQQ